MRKKQQELAAGCTGEEGVLLTHYKRQSVSISDDLVERTLLLSHMSPSFLRIDKPLLPLLPFLNSLAGSYTA